MKDKIEHFNSISNDERKIILALTAYYAPIGQTALQSLLKSNEILAADKVAKIDKTLKEQLQRAGLIEVTVDGWQCHPDLVHRCMKLAVQQPWFDKLAKSLLADLKTYYQERLAVLHVSKRLRIFIYKNEEVGFLNEVDRIGTYYHKKIPDIFNAIFFNDYDEEWFTHLPERIQFRVLKFFVDNNLYYLSEYPLQYQLLEQLWGKRKPINPLISSTLIEQRLLRGHLDNIEPWLIGDQSAQGLQAAGTLRFLQNRYDDAVVLYSDALKALKKETNKRNISLDGLFGYFFSLALLASQKPSNLTLLKQNTQITIKYGLNDTFYLLNLILLEAVDIYQGKKTPEQSVYLFKSNEFGYERLFQALLLYWLDEIKPMLAKNNNYLNELALYCLRAEQNGLTWYATVSARLLQQLNFDHEGCKAIANKYADSPYNSIINLLPKVEKWQRALQALTNLKPELATVDAFQKEQRMVWSLSLFGNQATLTPLEQKLGKNGRWTKGRPVALKRLHQNRDEFDYLTEQDQRICAQIQSYQERGYYSYGKESYEIPTDAIITAIGHPNIFWSDTENRVEITVAEPQLLVKEQKTNLHISLLPAINKEIIILQKTASNGLQVFSINDQHRQVAEILGKDGLTVPKSAKQQVIDSIASIASLVTVQSDIGGASSFAETVESDSRLHIHLQPIGLGLQVEIFIQPFPNGGPLYKPGVGGNTVLAEIDGKQLQTTRNFKQEKKYLNYVLNDCPLLYPDIEAKWLLDDPELALEVLLYLQSLADFAVLEWPKGKKIQISRELGLSQTRFSVRKEKDWFSVEGKLEIDEQQVLDIQQLMALLQHTPGRFLKLEDGQVIALTKELRQRLEDLKGVGDVNKDQIRFHPLASQTLDDLTAGMNIVASKPWQEQLKRLNELQDLKPVPPSTFQGELRDYQKEGYQWLSRLAHWGAGACLADDMGLGKTIQALALILSRAPDGPSLILAPTSVCINWLEECARFAPTLNVHQFGAGNRQNMLDEAGPFDLIVCSYGLLQTEAERLAEKHWRTLVADEAQAFKNAVTKRSKAVMNLQADFKIITTGTPIENHLGELWNLFNFINPGLLGSLNKFNERYAQAIEGQKDHQVQLRLKKLLRPFILRRLKNDVLTELPSRTEVTLHVDLSPEERAFYEALRRNAMQTMQESTEQAGAKHLKMLAEIMKLRRACCNPRLVLEDSPIASSKLAAFSDLVDELLENKHKALVFSQFVSHLALIRELLDSKGISYHYLDGSTPAPQRKTAMNAFQAGEGDLFLISLKAGGTGLNLTAADYVIHMDPWWNPAVEDQASDRAHRMGQKRPVTIYRLVAKDTIEDKIVDLHKHKRDLANSLLEGTEVSGKMSIDDMLALIKEIE